MANIWEKAISILAGNLNSGRSYHITTVLCVWKLYTRERNISHQLFNLIFFCNVFAGQQVSQNEFDNEYGTMSMGVGRFFQDFDDYQIEDEAQAVNDTITVSIASMLW